MSIQPTTLAEHIEDDIARNGARFAEVGPAKGPGDWCTLTPAQVEVFGIDPACYPRAMIALIAYQHFDGFCSGTDYPSDAFKAARRERPTLAAAPYSVAAFAAFANAFAGVHRVDAYAVWYRYDAWELRQGHVYYRAVEEAPGAATTAWDRAAFALGRRIASYRGTAPSPVRRAAIAVWNAVMPVRCPQDLRPCPKGEGACAFDCVRHDFQLSYEPEEHSAAWEADPVLRDKLELAGWRYANLIGITEPDERSPDQLEALDGDKKTYGHLVRTVNGLKEWHCKEATGFVAEVANTSREVAAAWLDHDWHGGGEV